MSKSYSDRSHARNTVLQRMGEGRATWNKRICLLQMWDKESEERNQIFVLRKIRDELLRLYVLYECTNKEDKTKQQEKVSKRQMDIRRIEDKKESKRREKRAGK